MKDIFISFLPIAALLIALAGLKWKAWQATLLALAAALGGLPLMQTSLQMSSVPGTLLGGVGFALCPICFVVFAALFTYAVTVESGALAVIKRGLAGVSDDKRVLALLIAWGFGNFMEGMAGFGTAVAIPAAILAGIGFHPFKAVLICLIANTTPTAFGSVGVPLLTLARESGTEPAYLARTTVFMQLAVTALGPFFVLFVADGFKAFCDKKIWKPLLVTELAFLGPWLLSAAALGCELPDILGGLCVLAALTVTAPRCAVGGGVSSRKEYVWAWLPFAFVVVILSVAAFMPSSFKRFVTPGALVLTAGILGALAQGLSVKKTAFVLWKTLRDYWAAFLTICLILALARVMVESGMITTLAKMLVSTTGKAYPFVAPVVGALGGFVTGSGTSSCVLFGRLQADAAISLGLAPEWLAAANVMGAGIGKMICPQSIAIGTVAAQLAAGSESRLFRKALPWFLGTLLCASLITGLFA